MFRVDTDTASSVLPVPTSPGTPGYFKNGANATVPGRDWFNMIQEELMSIVISAGITPSKTTRNQVLAALGTLFIAASNTRLANALQAPADLSDIHDPAVALSNIGGVPTSRTLTAGTGLNGGGPLSANVTLSVSYGTVAGTAAQGNDSRIVNAVPNSRQIIAGTGLDGGGALSANVTLTVSYGTAAGTAAQGNDSRIVNAVPNSRQVIAGTGHCRCRAVAARSGSGIGR